MSEAILRVRNLKKFFPIKGGVLQRTQANVHAVDGVSFDIGEGECIGLVGESGCGKSTLGRCIIHLIEPTSGEILYRGSDVSGMDRKELWSRIQMVFQDPMSSLNPRLTIGYCVGEPL
ncbi:MAG: ATP-binding cassette domain-containing protein, partial [Candidatus Bathyarchaeota archaeon]|nr:ATP-binding cassette domain-containing protein [Candidatus Bathyarchaeota archaeon]